jgi:hypothetical protein
MEHVAEDCGSVYAVPHSGAITKIITLAFYKLTKISRIIFFNFLFTIKIGTRQQQSDRQ